jgi:hypothetical protein
MYNVKGKFHVLLVIGIIVFSVSLSLRAGDVLPFVQLPFDLASGYLVFSVPIEPSGSLSLLFDTGCQTATIGKDVLDIKNREQAVTLILGTQKLKIDSYRINPKTAFSKATGQRIDGVIGNDILHRFTVKIDFKNKLLSLFENEEFILECDDMEIYISTSKKGLLAGSKYAGIVRNKFFQNFNVIFDYRRKSLHIEKF